MCSEVEAGNFTTLVYSILLIVGKIVLEMMKTLQKNSLIIAKDVRIILVSFTVIAIKISKENWRHYFCTALCNLLSA
jgi:hypothetical protein